jgi:hypothetical protein
MLSQRICERVVGSGKEHNGAKNSEKFDIKKIPHSVRLQVMGLAGTGPKSLDVAAMPSASLAQFQTLGEGHIGYLINQE